MMKEGEFAIYKGFEFRVVDETEDKLSIVAMGDI